MIDINLLIEIGATYRKAGVGEIIFTEGTSGIYYYQLVSGRIRWSHFSDDGKETLHRLVEMGECFGEFPLFDGEPYAATAIADTPCVFLRLRAEAFHELLHAHPHIHFAFSKHLVQHLRFKFFLTNTLSKNSPERVLTNLIDYYNRHGKYVCQDCHRLLLTRQQLANMVGMRVETVIRAIKHMQKAAKLCIVKGKVFLPAEGI